MNDAAKQITSRLESLGYSPVRELGRGGMGIVLLAQQKSLSRLVAIKILLAEAADQTLIGRFQREGRVYKELSHPNLVRVFDVGFEPPLPYLVFEYVSGAKTLSGLIGTKLDAATIRRLLTGIARALAYIHTNKIVHRDLKPANVLIEEDGEPKLIDLGVARVLEADLTRYTQPGCVLGTPAYAAPEQLMGEEVGPAADVYAWALIAIELLSGRQIFSGSGEDAVPFYRRLTDGLPSLSRLIPDVEPILERTLTRCSAMKPGDRPVDGSELVALLEKVGAADGAGATSPETTGAVRTVRLVTGAARTGGAPPAAAALRVASAPQARLSLSRLTLLRLAMVLVAMVAMAAGLRSSRERSSGGRSPAASSPVSPVPPEAGRALSPEEEAELGLSVDPGEISVVGALATARVLRLDWRADGRDDHYSRPVAGRFRVRLPASRLQSFRISLDGRAIDTGKLLAPHAARMAQVLEQVDWAEPMRKARALIARPDTQMEATPADLLPSAVVRELARAGAVLEPMLDTAAEDLQRRLLLRVWSLELLDGQLNSRGRTRASDAGRLAGSWGEQVAQTQAPDNPLAVMRARPHSVRGDPRVIINGQQTKIIDWYGSPEFDHVAIQIREVRPAVDSDLPFGVIWVGAPFQIEWDRPVDVPGSTSLMVESDIGLLRRMARVQINDSLDVPLCRWLLPGEFPAHHHVVRSRRLPGRPLVVGRNRMVVSVMAYPGAYDKKSHANFAAIAIHTERSTGRSAPVTH